MALENAILTKFCVSRFRIVSIRKKKFKQTKRLPDLEPPFSYFFSDVLRAYLK